MCVGELVISSLLAELVSAMCGDGNESLTCVVVGGSACHVSYVGVGERAPHLQVLYFWDGNAISYVSRFQ